MKQRQKMPDKRPANRKRQTRRTRTFAEIRHNVALIQKIGEQRDKKKTSFKQLEIDHDLRPASGMTAYRVIKEWRRLQRELKKGLAGTGLSPEDGEVVISSIDPATMTETQVSKLFSTPVGKKKPTVKRDSAPRVPEIRMIEDADVSPQAVSAGTSSVRLFFAAIGKGRDLVVPVDRVEAERVSSLIGKTNIIRFVDKSGASHAILMDNVFHVAIAK